MLDAIKNCLDAIVQPLHVIADYFSGDIAVNGFSITLIIIMVLGVIGFVFSLFRRFVLV